MKVFKYRPHNYLPTRSFRIQKCSSTVYFFFQSVQCYLVFHSFWDKEQNFIVSQNRPSHCCKFSLKATLSCILTANSCWKKKSTPLLWPWVHLPPANTGTYRPCWEAQGSHSSHEHSTESSLQQGQPRTESFWLCSQAWRGSSCSQFPCLQKVLLLTNITEAFNTFLDIRWKALFAYWNENAPS